MIIQAQFVCSRRGDAKTRIYSTIELSGKTVEEALDKGRQLYKDKGFTSVRLQRHQIICGYDKDLVNLAASRIPFILKSNSEIAKGLAIHIAAREVYDQKARDFLHFRSAVAREYHFTFERREKVA